MLMDQLFFFGCSVDQIREVRQLQLLLRSPVGGGQTETDAAGNEQQQQQLLIQ